MSNKIKIITDTKTLNTHVEEWRSADYITVDTEFIRDKTYWPQLCLVQVGGPKESVIIDPLAREIELNSLFNLLNEYTVLKVFHAARQDIEVFHHLSGKIPKPIYDTQIAASVCGFGDSVGYEKLANKLAGVSIDKTLRFTDWSQRPLSEGQLNYALSDVSHLRIIYEKLKKQLSDSGRESWLSEEFSSLLNLNNYDINPQEAWRRIKTRGGSKQFYGILKNIAAWRETQAKTQNVPRGRILKDEALTEIAAIAPNSTSQLSRVRAISQKTAESERGHAILDCVKMTLKSSKNTWPSPPPKKEIQPGVGPMIELLKVLLKTQSESEGVAQRIIANNFDLQQIAALSDKELELLDEQIPALKGWRLEIFGNLALALRDGRLALAIEKGKIKVISIEDRK